MKLPAALYEMNHAERSALVALLWSSTDDNGEPLDSDPYHPTPGLIARVASDWRRFIAAAEALGFDPFEHRATAINSADCDELDYTAHDFILTRNYHGAGFWDGGWRDPWGKVLSDLAQSFEELYIEADPETGEVSPYG
jgi:hypothetical protein